MHQERVLTNPIVITDIPYSDSGLQPRQFRLQFDSPDTPDIFNLQLYVMSDTYMKTDQVINMTLDVCRKDFGPSPPKKRQNGPDKKLFMEKYLSLMCPESEGEALARFVAKIKKRSIMKKAAIRKALAVEHGKPDADGQPPSTAKTTIVNPRGDFNAWNKMAVITRLGSAGLEKHIPDSLGTDDWVDWKYCDPHRNYISEWTVSWDCVDDCENEWVDIRGKLSGESLKTFNEQRITAGREIGGYLIQFDPDRNEMTDGMAHDLGGSSEIDSSDQLSVVTPPASEDADSLLDTRSISSTTRTVGTCPAEGSEGSVLEDELDHESSA